MATATLSAAAAKFIPPVNIGLNRIPIYRAGTLSDSGSGYILAAKVPVSARNLRWEGMQNAGAATQVINVGLRHGHDASTSFSALGAMGTQNVPVWTDPIDVKGTFWDDTGGERWKYVIFSKESGTASASLVIQGNITYDHYGSP